MFSLNTFFQLTWHRGDCKTLEKHMDRRILPLSLGGTLHVEDVENWFQFVLEKEDDFEGKKLMNLC